MRKAELIMALVMAVFSVYIMWKSTELPVGWIPEEGPGGGAFCLWLGAGMLVCCIAIIYRWAKRISPPSQNSSSDDLLRHAIWWGLPGEKCNSIGKDAHAHGGASFLGCTTQVRKQHRV